MAFISIDTLINILCYSHIYLGKSNQNLIGWSVSYYIIYFERNHLVLIG